MPERLGWEEVDRLKAAALEARRAGKSIQQLREELNISVSRWQKWRQTDPGFRALLETISLAESAGYREGVPVEFGNFVGRYFPDRRPHQPQQLLLVEALQDLEPSEVCLFLIFPEAGKTATLEDYIGRKLALDPSHRFRYVSQSQDLSKNVVGTVKRRMTETAEWGEYIGRFGPFYEKNQERSGRPWSTEEITVRKSKGTERDKSVVASSWRSATTGSRIDTLILDDVQTPENYNQAGEIFKRIRSAFFSRSLDMRTLIIGHRIGDGDVYDLMKDAGLITKEIVLPAAGGNPMLGINVEPGTPSIPEFWTRIPRHHTAGACCGGLIPFRDCPNDGSLLTAQEAMDLKRHQVGEDAWFAMYQQDPSSDALTTFSAWVDQCLDHNRVIGQHPKVA